MEEFLNPAGPGGHSEADLVAKMESFLERHASGRKELGDEELTALTNEFVFHGEVHFLQGETTKA